MSAQLLSVIVPIYNVEKYVGKCIKSILSSSYTYLELILVNDGSSDDSGKICEEYALNDKRIKVIHKENGGLVSARKAGVLEARGKYITFVDGDDYIEEDLYKNVMDILQANDVGFLNFRYYEYDEDGNKIKPAINNLPDGVYSTHNIASYVDDKAKCLAFLHCAVTKVYEADLIKKAITKVDNNVKKGEDLNITLSCLQLTDCFYNVNNITGLCYVMRDTSMTHTYDKNSIENTANYVKSSLKLCVEGGNTYSDSWNKLIYNEAYNIMMSDCIGCTFKYYGKRRPLSILLYFRKLADNETFHEFFYDIIIVKTGYAFPEVKEYGNVMSLTEGATLQDTSRLPFKRIMRPMFPIDKI